MKRVFFLFGFFVCYINTVLSQSHTFQAVKYPENYTAKLDEVYVEVQGWEGRMDIYANLSATQPTPVVLNIHGGGWNHGEKESQTGFGSFFKNGFAVANVEYRLANVAKAPAAIEDIRCAFIYLFKHAEELNIDTDKVVLMGSSAGGHLALMAGLLENNRMFDANCKAYEGEIKVAAIIDKFGPTDLTMATQNKTVIRWVGHQVSNNRFMRAISPVFQVSEDSPPVFIVHGDKDPIVPYSQSKLLYNKLKDYGVKVKLVTVENGKHGRFSEKDNLVVMDEIWTFLKELGL
ncbi:alpha/beta hydrolase [Tamlana crocina]|uniref:Alpha/beta hydrolase n=1 Tax=Tamlana crocina TaxID=393006 RepID=A0ABX1DJI1_9FLAO|nr:alpha/beta hydrolase [Tamlana crocina]NJX16471.1 alpha/beta hydrolase [Tamlana crocina]